MSAKIIKFPLSYAKRLKLINTMFDHTEKAAVLKKWASLNDSYLSLMKMARNTFSRSRKSVANRSGIIMGDKHFKRALEKGIGPGQAKITMDHLADSRNGFKQAIRDRRKFGKLAVRHSEAKKKIINKIAADTSEINRIVSARGKGIAFRRIGGRIVPIRVKK